MNDTVIILCVFLFCAGFSCGQTVWECHTVHRL